MMERDASNAHFHQSAAVLYAREIPNMQRVLASICVEVLNFPPMEMGRVWIVVAV
jgi:hypothetical protein